MTKVIILKNKRYDVLISKKIKGIPCIIKIVRGTAYWWNGKQGELVEPLTNKEIEDLKLQKYIR